MLEGHAQWASGSIVVTTRFLPFAFEPLPAGGDDWPFALDLNPAPAHVDFFDVSATVTTVSSPRWSPTGLPVTPCRTPFGWHPARPGFHHRRTGGRGLTTNLSRAESKEAVARAEGLAR